MEKPSAEVSATTVYSYCCLDINECHQENTCAGAGEWCVNTLGGHICCSPESEHPECRGLELVPEGRHAIAIANSESNNVNGDGNVAESNAFATLKGRKGFKKGEETEDEEGSFEEEREVKRKKFRTSKFYCV